MDTNFYAEQKHDFGKNKNRQMKGQSEIAYLPTFANIYILLIVMVIVITE